MCLCVCIGKIFVPMTAMKDNYSRIKASLKLFQKLNCIFSDLEGDSHYFDAALALIDVEKMRHHVVNCLIALELIHIRNEKIVAVAANDDYKLVKCKVFNASINVILDDELDRNEAVVNTILSVFPFADERKISDEQSWLPQYFAVALAIRSGISEDILHAILSVDLSATHRLIKKESHDNGAKHDEGNGEIVRSRRLSISRDGSLGDLDEIVFCN
jgi:hypothetical protein